MKDTNKNEVQATETVTLEDMTKEQLIDLIYQLADENKELEDDDFDDDDDCGCDCCDCGCDDFGDIVDPVVGFNLENVIDSRFDEEEFNKGVKSMSFVAGQLMTLQNAGIKPQSALEYLHASHAQGEDCKYSLEIAKLQANLNKDAEKKSLIESKKNMA